MRRLLSASFFLPFLGLTSQAYSLVYEINQTRSRPLAKTLDRQAVLALTIFGREARLLASSFSSFGSLNRQILGKTWTKSEKKEISLALLHKNNHTQFVAKLY